MFQTQRAESLEPASHSVSPSVSAPLLVYILSLSLSVSDCGSLSHSLSHSLSLVSLILSRCLSLCLPSLCKKKATWKANKICRRPEDRSPAAYGQGKGLSFNARLPRAWLPPGGKGIPRPILGMRPRELELPTTLSSLAPEPGYLARGWVRCLKETNSQ